MLRMDGFVAPQTTQTSRGGGKVPSCKLSSEEIFGFSYPANL